MAPNSGFGPGARRFWQAGIRYGGPLFRWMWSLEVDGTPPAPPFVAAANHFSHVDTLVVGRAIGPLRYLAVDELYGQWGSFDALITWFGAIPVSRTGAPLGALRTALGWLEEGGVVGVFPEGRRVWTWGEAEPKRGAAWLACRSGVPLVPVAVWGTQESMGRGARHPSRWPVSVRVLEPLHPASYQTVPDPTSAMTRDWRSAVGRALAEMSYRE